MAEGKATKVTVRQSIIAVGATMECMTPRAASTPGSGHNDLEFFRLVSVTPSLTALARELGTSLSGVSRRLSAIEERLGVQLVRRTTRRLEVTPEGVIYAEQSKKILAEIDRLEESLRQRDLPLEGMIRVYATMGFGRRRVAPIIAEFQTANPGIELQLTLSSAPLGPSASPFDIGIRIGPGPDSRLVARRILANTRVVCAAPAYLAKHSDSAITAPEDLLRHDCIVLRQFDDDFALWRFTRGEDSKSLRVNGALSSNDGEVVTDWCLDGHGVMLRSRWHVQKLLDAGELIEVLEDWASPAADIYVTREPGPRIPARVSAFIDFLTRRLGDEA
jgi:LysR family transcriptional activator of dmlA